MAHYALVSGAGARAALPDLRQLTWRGDRQCGRHQISAHERGWRDVDFVRRSETIMRSILICSTPMATRILRWLCLNAPARRSVCSGPAE